MSAADRNADRNAYLNFVLYAVLGRMAEADEVMRRHSDAIESVARFLAKQRPIAPAPVYRGMLVDPAVPLVVDHRYTFVSWSEDVDVACWFGSADSIISAPLAASNPRLRGVVLTMPAPRRVLFHHSWSDEDGRGAGAGAGWSRLALLHPHMGPDGARQIAWSLRTQREVITAPVELPEPTPTGIVRTKSVADLDAQFAPGFLFDVKEAM